MTDLLTRHPILWSLASTILSIVIGVFGGDIRKYLASLSDSSHKSRQQRKLEEYKTRLFTVTRLNEHKEDVFPMLAYLSSGFIVRIIVCLLSAILAAAEANSPIMFPLGTTNRIVPLALWLVAGFTFGTVAKGVEDMRELMLQIVSYPSSRTRLESKIAELEQKTKAASA